MDAEAASWYSSLIHKTVKGHLNWVFRRAERPYSFWHRSYLVTGPPKDGPLFQLDQQCYPYLELCDFFAEFPEESAFVEGICKEPGTSVTLALLESKRDAVTGLFPTDETPGDDAVEYPFHFSSHILLWYTFARFHDLTKAIGVDSEYNNLNLDKVAQEVRHSTIRHFETVNPNPGKPLFAYLTDGAGKTTLYHDANDIPTVLAPIWSFVQSKLELELWRNTMEFGVSPSNEKGYFIGEPFGGLGSVHTPDPWPLGFFQEFVFAQMTGNAEAEADAWRRIKGTMMWDGLFSEAIDRSTGECTSKAWFSWPGSMISGALVKPNRGKNYLEA